MPNMKPGFWNCFVRKGGLGGTTLVCMLTLARVMQAQQQVLAPPPAYSVTPMAMQEYETNQPGAPRVEQFATGVEGTTPPRWTLWGPVTLHPHLLYRFLYGTGIESAPGQTENTIIQQFSPGVLFALGRHWTLDYTPLFSFYSSSSFHNSTDESVVLTWGTSYDDWIFGFSQGYTSSSAPLVQTGMQTDTQDYATSAKASYHFSGKMSVDLSISQNFSSAEQFTSTKSWSTMDWLNYDTGARWDVGVGVGYEYDDVNPGPNTMEEQLQGRIRWQASEKINFALHGGLEYQQYLDGGAGNLITPVFGASVQYQPINTTTISLSGDRSISPSLFQGQVIETTSVGISLSQRLLTRLNLSLGSSYGHSNYRASTNNPTTGTGRTDNYYAFTARLGTTWLDKGTASIFYQYSHNPSTEPGFTFSSSQVGAEIGYRF